MIASALYLTQKIRDLYSNPGKILKDFVIVFFSVFIAMITAIILDSFLRSNELYNLVLVDTFTHMPENVSYSASPPLTNNVHPLMFYTLLVSMLFP